MTTATLHQTRTIPTPTLQKHSRKLDTEKLERNKDKIEEANQLIIHEEIDKGVAQITEIMQTCRVENRKRKEKHSHGSTKAATKNEKKQSQHSTEREPQTKTKI